MLHYIKIHAKKVCKTIAFITNTIVAIEVSLQASGVMAMLSPMFNLGIALSVILLNMFTHALKVYVEPEAIAQPKASA